MLQKQCQRRAIFEVHKWTEDLHFVNGCKKIIEMFKNVEEGYERICIFLLFRVKNISRLLEHITKQGTDYFENHLSNFTTQSYILKCHEQGYCAKKKSHVNLVQRPHTQKSLGSEASVMNPTQWRCVLWSDGCVSVSGVFFWIHVHCVLLT